MFDRGVNEPQQALRLTVQVLGNVSCTFDGEPVNVPAKLPPLLAFLTTSRTGKVRRASIARHLWGDDADGRADGGFRQFLRRLKSVDTQLGFPALLIEGSDVSINADRIDLDLSRIFEGGDMPEKLLLEKARDVADGALLAGVEISTEDYEEWFRETLDRLSQSLVPRLGAILEASGRELPRCFEIATTMLHLDPSREDAWRAVMRYHIALGDIDTARRTYRDCVKTLEGRYGVEPHLSTVQLAAQIEQPVRVAASPAIAPVSTQPQMAVVEKGDGRRIGVPRVILLPPKSIASQPEAADTIAMLLDDVTAGLTRYRTIAAVAGHTARNLAERGADDLTNLSETYGVHYAVRTIVKPTSKGFGASITLLDCRSSESLASIDTGEASADLVRLFSQISEQVVSQFVAAIERSEVAMPSAAPDRVAYRHFLEGRRALWHSDLPDIRKARKFFTQALASHEGYAPALAGMARTLSMEKLVRGFTDNSMLIESLSYADRAIELDPVDGRGIRERGFAALYLRRHDDSLEAFDMAELRNPNDADLLADHADALTHSGMSERALKRIVRAKSLNPKHPDTYNWIHASILYQMTDYAGAMEILHPMRSVPAVARLLAASAAMDGDQETAQYFASQFRSTYPDFDAETLLDIVPDRNATDTRHLLEGLRLAGIA